MAGAGFPLFAKYMFNGMGVNWASTLLGCVAFLLVPIPIMFKKYGARIRARSKFAPTNIGNQDTAHRESGELSEESEGNKRALLEKTPTQRSGDAGAQV